MIAVLPEIAIAIAQRQPVVAFETTILSFGLPSPLNEEIGLECERVARDSGAVPATIAILDGLVQVGLTLEQLRYFCTRDERIRKVNLQNFAAVLAAHEPGALTVAASMQACTMANIRVFATGGIGGVHRGFAQTLDISSDLQALASYPVAVVCAGAKSILDIGATLEALETLGVPVVGFRTRSFPLFFTAESEHALETSFDDVETLASFLDVHFSTSQRGVLIATPVPQADSVARHELDRWIASALEEAARQRVSGKAVTPFLLRQLEQDSEGKTLAANRALILNNARLAAQLAVAVRNL